MTMIGKAVAALAFAAALAVASIPSDAFAQRGGHGGGGGGFRGGGGFGGGGFGGGGFRGGFGGGGFRGGFGGGGFRGGFGGGGFRGGFGGGPRFVYGGGQRFYGGGFRRGFYGYRRPFIRYGIGLPLYVGYPRCYRLVRVATPWGWGWRRIWVCGPRYRSIYY
jgi:hypothetical protein